VPGALPAEGMAWGSRAPLPALPGVRQLPGRDRSQLRWRIWHPGCETLGYGGKRQPRARGQPCHTHRDRKTRPGCHPRVGTLSPTPRSWLLPGGCMAVPLLPIQPWAGAGTATPARGQPQRGGSAELVAAFPSMGDGPLGSWQALACRPRRCRACSLRLTTSHGLPAAKPRDPAATPSPFRSPSHNPAPSAGPDAAAQSARPDASGSRLPGHVGSTHAPAPCWRCQRRLRHRQREIFPRRWWLWGRDGAARRCSRSTGWVCGLLSDSAWHRLCARDTGADVPSGSTQPRSRALGGLWATLLPAEPCRRVGSAGLCRHGALAWTRNVPRPFGISVRGENVPAAWGATGLSTVTVLAVPCAAGRG